MKLAFSTLGCPDFDWPDIYAMAKDFGFNGIEIRGLGNDIYGGKSAPVYTKRAPRDKEKACILGLEIPCLSSGCCLKFKEKEEETKSEIRSYIALAKELGTPYIRILADLEPNPTTDVDDTYVVSILKELAPEAKTSGTTLLVETNGVYADTARLAKLLEAVDHPSVMALWDMHHPYRYMGESAQQTIDNIGRYIKYVHVKDSVMAGDTVAYKMMGEGDLTNQGYALRAARHWLRRLRFA